jgi:hypothetical protein
MIIQSLRLRQEMRPIEAFIENAAVRQSMERFQKLHDGEKESAVGMGYASR